MKTPVVLVTGVDPDAMAATQLGLLWDLPHAVAVRHHLDPARSVLTRVVSDITGVVEHEEIELEHACTSCALREDIVPTLDRLARDGRWASIVAHLPVGAEADQVCTVLSWDAALARRLRVAAVVTALTRGRVVEDLLGSDTLAERGLHSSEDDERGVGEVACSMVEYADLVVTAAGPLEALAEERSATELDLLRVLARPGVRLATAPELLPGATLLQRPHHRHDATRAWASHVREGDLPGMPSNRVWCVDLRAERPFHPDRLLEDLESLGAGPHRSRGCFWLPTRPDRALLWEGSGGQLSVGDGEPWGRRTPRTRLVFVGVGDPPPHLSPTFASLLVPHAAIAPGVKWRYAVDGFEPWLGPIRHVA